MKQFVKEDEGHLVEPYLGGFNSQKSTILIVEFHDFTQVQKEINPRWRAFREMVEDMQKMLLTGGVKTNIFKNTDTQIVCVLNDAAQLEMAREFFSSQPEVSSVTVTD
jgi:aspartate/glutamate racemase